MNAFSDRIRDLRIENGYSLKKFADKIGVSDVAVMNWERGTNEPKASCVKSIALAFNISANYLLGLEDNNGVISLDPFPIKKDPEILCIYRKLPPKGKNELLAYSRGLAVGYGV